MCQLVAVATLVPTKMSSTSAPRARDIETPSKDEWEALFAIRKEQQDTSGHRVKGTLQIIIMHPKEIILFSEKLVRLYHHVAKHDIVYTDAAGSILYSLVVSTVMRTKSSSVTHIPETLLWPWQRILLRARIFHLFPILLAPFATQKAYCAKATERYPSWWCVMGA